jgi:hypothetical protein
VTRTMSYVMTHSLGLRCQLASAHRREQAVAYCASLGKRLPREDEWEWAAPAPWAATRAATARTG